MATHKSAEKRNRQNIKAKERNTSAMSAVKTAIRDVKAAATSGSKKEDLMKVLKVAQKAIASSARKGVMSAKTGSRYVSRLASLVNKTASK